MARVFLTVGRKSIRQARRRRGHGRKDGRLVDAPLREDEITDPTEWSHSSSSCSDCIYDPFSFLDDKPLVLGAAEMLFYLDGFGEAKVAASAGKEIMQFANFDKKFTKHVLVRKEFGENVSESDYLKMANDMFDSFTHTAYRARTDTTIYLNEQRNEIMFVKDNLIESFYRVSENTIKQYGSLIDYFNAVRE
jgi:hypothetical protein